MANELRIPNGLFFDFTPDDAGDADVFLLRASSGEITSLDTIPGDRIGGGNLTEYYGSDILSIIGGDGALLHDATIQVQQATTSTSGYLSSTDWNTFNNKLGTSLASARVWVGNNSGVATARSISGDISISDTGVAAISNGVIVDADVKSDAAIAFSKMAAFATKSSVLVSDDTTGFVVESSITSAELLTLSGISGNVQDQLDDLRYSIVNRNTSTLLQNPTASENFYAIVWDNTNSQWTLSPAGAGGTLTGPGSSTDNAVPRWNGTGGDSLKNSSIILDDSNNITGVASITIGPSGLHLLDTDSSHDLVIVAGSDLTADRTLTFITGDSARAITLSGNPTLNDWFDQGVKTTSDTSFLSVTVSNSGGIHVLDSDSSHDLILSTASNLSADRTLLFNTGDVNRTLTINASGTVYVTGGTDVSMLDGGTGASLTPPAADALYIWDNTAGLTRLASLSGLVYNTYTNSIGLSSAISGGDADELQKNDGAGGFSGSKIFSAIDGSLTMGDTSTSGSSRSISVEGSSPDVGLNIGAQGNGGIIMYPGLFGGAGTLQLIGFDSATNKGGEIDLSPSGVIIRKVTDVTGSVQYVQLRHETTATPALGIGTGINFETETSASNFEIGSVIESVSTNVGSGSEAFKLVFKTMTSGGSAAERFSVDSSFLSSEVALRLDSVFIQRDNTYTNFLEHNQIVATLGTTAFKSAEFDYSYPGAAVSNVFTVRIEVAGRRSGSNEGYTKVMYASFKVDSGGTMTQIGSTTDLVTHNDFTGTVPTAVVSVSGANVRVTVDSNSVGVNMRANIKFTAVTVAES